MGLLVAAAAVCPLLAARWEAEVAVASALRWLSAGFFAVVSIAIWLRERWGIAWFAKPQAVDRPGRAVGTVCADLLVALVVLVYVAMGAYVVQAALWRAGLPSDLGWLWPYLLVWALVAGRGGAAVAPQAAAVR